MSQSLLRLIEEKSLASQRKAWADILEEGNDDDLEEEHEFDVSLIKMQKKLRYNFSTSQKQSLFKSKLEFSECLE